MSDLIAAVSGLLGMAIVAVPGFIERQRQAAEIRRLTALLLHKTPSDAAQAARIVASADPTAPQPEPAPPRPKYVQVD